MRNYNYVSEHNKFAEINRSFKLSLNSFCDLVSDLLRFIIIDISLVFMYLLFNILFSTRLKKN